MSKFTDAVEASARREGLPGSGYISPGFTSICQECLDQHDICCKHKYDAMVENGEWIDDSLGFSNERYDLCDSLPGDRYPAHFFVDGNPDNEIIHLEVCQDCLCYLANGDEPEDWRE